MVQKHTDTRHKLRSEDSIKDERTVKVVYKPAAFIQTDMLRGSNRM